MATSPTPHILSCFYCGITEPSKLRAACKKCNRTYCDTDASKLDPNYCIECLNDVTINDKVIMKDEEDYDPYGDQMFRRNFKVRIITLQGDDWRFFSEAIHRQNDNQLVDSINYHRGMVSMLETELAQRRVDKINSAINLNRNLGASNLDKPIKPKTAKSPKAVDMNALAELLKNLSPEQLAAMGLMKG